VGAVAATPAFVPRPDDPPLIYRPRNPRASSLYQLFDSLLSISIADGGVKGGVVYGEIDVSSYNVLRT
jgi:hypothetical protein